MWKVILATSVRWSLVLFWCVKYKIFRYIIQIHAALFFVWLLSSTGVQNAVNCLRAVLPCVLVTCSSTIIRRTSANQRCWSASKYDVQYIPLTDFHDMPLPGWALVFGGLMLWVVDYAGFLLVVDYVVLRLHTDLPQKRTIRRDCVWYSVLVDCWVWQVAEMTNDCSRSLGSSL